MAKKRKVPGSSRESPSPSPQMAAESVAATSSAHLALFSTCLFALFVRWAVSLNGYSGQGVPPLHGDFEAQRHWLEVTVNLPPREWYRHDLKYWGLDYPLLTAYHSWILGYIAKKMNPAWVELYTSRGHESEPLKIFMRATVLISEILIYFPAVVYFVAIWVPRSQWQWLQRNVLTFLILLQPALILIDHGHFQYNSIMLGFALWAIVMLMTDRLVLGSIFFVLALNFKQMALFYAIPVFFFILGKCVKGPRGFFMLIKVGLTVIATFAIVFSIYFDSIDDVLQVVRRVFPVERGLYEDKVANVWCAISVVIKLRQIFQPHQLVYLSLASTLAAVLPSSIHLFLNPSPKLLPYAMLNTSLGFFLFAFQVHEKSILLPLLPATLLILDDPPAAALFNSVAVFSMFPLLYRDGLALPYVVLSLFWIGVVYLAIIAIHILELTVPPRKSLPDVYVMANVGLCTAVFGVLLVYFNYRQMFDSPHTVKKLKRG
ncbi:ALG6, ALG8 glycosyltransferase family-domain-containing protein [Fimicolochytrium jonesii]|uniref:ALG6, ALG8 glycosyltransferase family-domain-containing protein n=1 Tax=Fimicolochytrium jonesii TaxID=1396493 RepID=UPI0022FDE241|nr:ALG6, ALG8 glycosyltransferase family-domain-containing protein [Fimicolochytrium jonesii]KAI8825192.1 ALG6, ALG8 glycosyltransferase family-domain-containing protein [Fimicolochytrium jonesii]